MRLESFELRGKHILLEPLETAHAPELAAAAAMDPSLYQWSHVPQGAKAMARYVDTALSARDEGKAWPFATRSVPSGTLLGSTRYFDLEWWPWPEGHERHDRWAPDACEIGYTWLTRDAIRTAANTEAKLLMLTYAFQVWGVHRVVLHTDERNDRSRAAIERIGGRFEGILRAHRMASDLIPRNSARFSLVAAEWPEVRAGLEARLAQGRVPTTPE
ncbi:MAG TPA: GNAT family protein [Acidobacteriaceae bacterium]|jgi:RimJ/RimL family protein N-acetyltransferase